jgi:hypothetical protein
VARDGKTADACNWLAYDTSKAGDAAAAIPIYEKAIEVYEQSPAAAAGG